MTEDKKTINQLTNLLFSKLYQTFVYKLQTSSNPDKRFNNIKTLTFMIKMFVMKTCPHCEYVERQVEGNPEFQVIDIGQHVRDLKQFLDLRDRNPAFNEAKRIGDIGIPCYMLEDGSVTLYSKDVGLEPMPEDNFGDACSIDGSGC